MPTVIRLRNATTTQWGTSTRTLAAGEVAIDTTLKKFKIGDGTKTYAQLEYANVLPSELTELVQDAIGAAFAAGTHSNITVTYDDATNKISLATGADVITTTSLSNTLTNATTGYVPIGDVGNADGVASLDSNGTIPDSEIPATIARDSELSSHTSATTNVHGIADTAALATKAYADNAASAAASALVASAPSTLNTLNELATALGNDASFSTTISTSLGNKEPLLPTQTGNSGKFLTTDGTTKSWATIQQYSLPSQASNSGKYLTTNGSVESWAVIPVTSTATATSKGTVYGFSSDTDAGSANVSYGWRSMANVTSGTDNLAIGFQTMHGMTTGINNLALGKYALLGSSSSSSNTAIGMWTLSQVTSGSANVAIGPFVMYNTTTGNENVAISQNALNYTNGDGNIGIGSSAGNALTTGSNNIIIGTYSNASSPTTSNQITLGDSRITSFRIPGLAVNWTTSAYGRATYASTSAPSGGSDGDVWLVYTA
jgi:hypothetical protein